MKPEEINKTGEDLPAEQDAAAANETHATDEPTEPTATPSEEVATPTPETASAVEATLMPEPSAPDTGAADEGAETARADLTSDAMPLRQVVEALLFSTDVPLSAGKLAETVGLDSTKPIKQVIDELNAAYAERQAAYRVEERAGGYQLLTLPQYADYIERLVRKKDEGRLTPAMLETLAIVAYKQPIIRADAEAIRGVACGEMLRSLMEHNLIKIVGRAEIVGRPMLYGTTRYFLEVFGLANLKDLPKAEALVEPK